MALKVHSMFTVIVLTVFVQICVSAELSQEDRIDHPCYPNCECKTNGSDFNVLCDGLNIDYVPKGLPIETTRLTLRYNQSQKVTNQTSQDTNLANLHSLDVSNSSKTIIEDIALKNTSFEYLEKLHFLNYSLSDTKQLISVIESSPKLHYIDIGNNNDIDCNQISNYFNKSGRIINISCGIDEVSDTTTVETVEPSTNHEHEYDVPLQRKPDHISTETNPNGFIDEDKNSPEVMWSSDTVESVSTNPGTTTTVESTSTIPSTTTTVESTSTNPSTTTTVESISTIPSTTTTVESTSTIPSTTTTVRTTSTIPATTTTATSTSPETIITTADSESLLDSTWFIAVVTIVGMSLIVAGLVIGWRYYQKYMPISPIDNDDDMYY